MIPLAFTYAYALTRSCMRGKPFFYALALLPLFAPSLMSALSLVYIFGNQGFLRALLFGNTIYGPIGIVDRAGHLYFSACGAHPRDGAGAVRWPTL